MRGEMARFRWTAVFRETRREVGDGARAHVGGAAIRNQQPVELVSRILWRVKKVGPQAPELPWPPAAARTKQVAQFPGNVCQDGLSAGTQDGRQIPLDLLWR